ncbi:hypothetical protein AIGOOFII_3494 [Methylobacterium marchantiae]|nr:hypothetical protein AIGOOFII_3494 [Methylobacterium marchantiae]
MLATLSLTGCGTTTGISAPSAPSYKEVLCQTIRPIPWSKRDTTATIVAVKEHNAVFKAEGCAPASTPR